MPKSSPNYTNFNGGEYSDLVGGRSDLEQYNKGGKDYKNTLATIYGPVQSRPGSFYSADTKTHSTKSRLIAHKFNPTDSTIIEMGDLYFRFFTSEGQVSGPLEVAHTYTEAELFEVQHVQLKDVISLFHKDHKPAKLTRLSASSWSLDDYVFKGNPYLPDNTTSTFTLTASTSAKGASGTLTAVGHTPFLADHVGTFWKVGDPHGSPLNQGYVEITGFTSTTVVNMTVIEALSTSAATADWAEAAWSDVQGWPARATYFKKRLWTARTDPQPNGYWASKPFIYDNFDPGTSLDDDAISDVAADAGAIQWMLGGRRLIMGSDTGDVIVSGDASGVFTPSSVGPELQTSWGTEAIQPELIGNYAYAVQLKARKVREINYLFQEDSYKSVDTTVFAEHITESGIVDMAYQRNPYSHLYCALTNGKMAVMCRESDQQVLGWTPHDTDGFYESVAVIPHPTEPHDMVWTITRRIIGGVTKRFVEYFDSPIIPERQDLWFCVDGGLRFNAYEANTGGTLTLSALTGDGITATAGASVFVSGDVGQRIRAIDLDTGEILGEAVIVGFTSGTVVTVDILEGAPFDSLTYIANAWGISVNTLSGLGHLEAKTVELLVDGGTNDDKIVASGSITLADGNDGFIIAVGLGYTSRWKNMPIEAGSATGTAQGKKKKIYQVGLKLYRTLGIKMGSDKDHLDEVILRSHNTLMGQVEPHFTGIVASQSFNSTYDEEGHIVVQQDHPLYMCLTSVMPLLQTNDK